MHNKHSKASLPSQSSNLSVNETVVSIVHHSKSKNTPDDDLIPVEDNTPSLEGYEISANDERVDPPPEKPWSEQLLTPWSLGSLLLILCGNLLLLWAQESPETPILNPSTNSQVTPQQTSSAIPVNLTPKNSPTLTLDNLSTLSVPSASTPKPSNSAPKPPQVSNKIPVPHAVPPKPPSNLTNALLPPSLQPQLVQTYPIQAPPSPSLSQALPVNPSVVQASPVQPPPVPQSAEKKAQLEQERILEEIRIREQKAPPLGFNHQTRAKLRSAGNQEAPAELIQQLQQLQQQKIDELNPTYPPETNNSAQ
ncbi:conserved hypothetical protein [Gloeothece citriformis PCC 7424]|uniref:Uncharacterized protein n=1 Tax=Gloeothece citriformis (strain PCC 7424) TaxID=65393 RepID=B7K9T5_GLOC7|nr:hypothetical protein [Gloeothece citriformis]ACK70053.1 conserved hypothetical protein [Gloeothece citriformis PCC 7424]